MKTKIVFILFSFVFFALSGCVSTQNTRTGRAFSPDTTATRDALPKGLDAKIGRLTDTEATALFGEPERSFTDSRYFVLGWEFSETKSKTVDLGVYTASAQDAHSRYLALVFEKKTKSLFYYRIVTEHTPSHTRAFSSKPLVWVAVTAIQYKILDRIVNNALQDSVNDADGRLQQRWDKIRNDLDDTLKDQLQKAKDDLDERLKELQKELNDAVDDAVNRINDSAKVVHIPSIP